MTRTRVAALQMVSVPELAPNLEAAVLPSVEQIARAIQELLEY